MPEPISYNLDLLEDFRGTATKNAGHLASIGNDVGAHAVVPSDFGTGPGGVALAEATARLVRATARQSERGDEVLHGVARAIDNVLHAIEDAERTNRQTFLAGSEKIGANPYRSPVGTPGGTTPGTGNTTTSAPGSPGHAHPGDMAPPVDPGTGVTVNLPGTLGTVEAPNARAAGAVRAALSQLGVPYVWAAESPGKGFDCSGLTKWAYGQEGVELAHFAASQDVGEPVSRANLAPGDLVVWDGHVAMYIGAGQVVEAPQTGDVVHVVPLYTHNGNDRFEGFFRPTA